VEKGRACVVLHLLLHLSLQMSSLGLDMHVEMDDKVSKPLVAPATSGFIFSFLFVLHLEMDGNAPGPSRHL